jgi:hypothetical protein
MLKNTIAVSLSLVAETSPGPASSPPQRKGHLKIQNNLAKIKVMKLHKVLILEHEKFNKPLALFLPEFLDFISSCLARSFRNLI